MSNAKSPAQSVGRYSQNKGKRNTMKDYHINIFYSEEDQGYIADIPDLKSCSAFGETPEQALEEMLLAKKSWLASAKSKGTPIPDPEYKPIIYQVA